MFYRTQTPTLLNIKERIKNMFYIKEKTKNTALIYISKDEAEKLAIKWTGKEKGYEITNKQEEIKKMQELGKMIGFNKFDYDINKTAEDEAAYLKDKGITEEMPYTMFISKRAELDPIIKFLNILENENKNTKNGNLTFA